MYVIKWIRESNSEDHLRYITSYKDVAWSSLRAAMLFKTPEEARDYVVKHLDGDKEEIISWLNHNTKILYIHTLNIG